MKPEHLAEPLTEAQETRRDLVVEFVAEARATAPVKPKGGGRARPIKVVDETGAVTGIVGHDRVLEGLLHRQGVDDAVVEGRRAANRACAAPGCGLPAMANNNNRGRLRKWCVIHDPRVRRCSDCGVRSDRVDANASLCTLCKSKRETCVECGGERSYSGLRVGLCEACSKVARCPRCTGCGELISASPGKVGPNRPPRRRRSRVDHARCVECARAWRMPSKPEPQRRPTRAQMRSRPCTCETCAKPKNCRICGKETRAFVDRCLGCAMREAWAKKTPEERSAEWALRRAKFDTKARARKAAMKNRAVWAAKSPEAKAEHRQRSVEAQRAREGG